MRIVLAPDSFKESLSATAVCDALAEGARRARPDADVIAIPLSDGGEGLVDVLVSGSRGRTVLVDAEDPLGRSLRAPLALLDGGRTVALEVAHAVGLSLLAFDERDPLRASSRGVGRLLLAALERRPDTILVGLGGSATVDGGCGLAQALGAGFRDRDGRPVPSMAGTAFAGRHLERVHRIDAAAARRATAGVRIEALCDVTTPLLDRGDRPGAARLYGPQKGATPAGVERLAAGLEALAAAVARSGGPPIGALPGGGAAGGLGAALHAFCGATIVSGFDRVADRLGLATALAGADLVITGEGRLDAQTAEGKVVAGVARLGRAAGVPVVAIVGDAALPAGDAGAELGLAAVHTLLSRAGSFERSRRCAAALLADAAAAALMDAP